MASSTAFVMCVVVFGLMFSSSIANDRTSTEIPETFDLDSDRIVSNNSCDDVRQVFVTKNIGSLKDTSDMTHEDETPLCSTSWNVSCCTPTMERRYTEASKREFQNMLQSSNAFLQNLLASSAAKFR
ncbi:Glypican-5, partial [Stegodyphus mimosarum]